MTRSWLLVGLVGALSAGCGSSGSAETSGSGATGGSDTGGSGAEGGASGSGAQGGSGAGGSGAQGGSDTGGSGAQGGSATGGSGAQGGSGADGGTAGVASGGSAGSAGSAGTAGTGGGPSTVRFVAMGDAGEGNATQYKVADAIKAECDSRGGCEFALYLGDNFYDVGVSSDMDTQFQTKFEMPYANLSFPFYITLGNHDYGSGGAGLELNKASYYISYGNASAKWYYPDRYYVVQHPGVDFFALDSNVIFLNGDSNQRSWFGNAVQQSLAEWKIAFGHHPYISNGKHGNAGTYEGIPLIPVISGGNVKDFMEDTVCGKIDVYICGHDHNMQWLQPKCGTEFIVSGSGAKTTGLEGRGTPTFFETDAKGGFLLVEITGKSFSGWFYDEDGNELFTRTVTKP